MKVHYINILLFALPLNILAHNKNKPHTTPHHTPKISTTRLLCECELYMPNYDNDPQMKKVMQQFEDRTTQRFHEYDDRMVEKRKECKDKCDKEIEKIILKDKLEKQMAQQLTTLETKIDTNDIPTCICEKSLADKMEKFCLNCGVNVGGGVILSSGVLGGIGEAAISAWQTVALATAKELAEKAGIAAGKAAGDAHGMKIVNMILKSLDLKKLGIVEFDTFFTKGYIIDVQKVTNIINTKLSGTCGANALRPSVSMCDEIRDKLGLLEKFGKKPPPDETAIENLLTEINRKAAQGAKAFAETTTEQVTQAAIETNTGVVQTTSYNWYTTIGYSVLAIIIIVLIMVIIYLILRYRRKKKMKKKLQYIKLLEE
ncbi:rifin PIR protein, putative [Plasmodium reichenowi]|uniref:Rifin PIR protein, putative n=1 Tax=Plasmodium reichenowi TaxID=5854 RepID=A0A2P9DCB2_PLARE|nr:rifin PIR protein, putative [Plasmodium reichenowi]